MGEGGSINILEPPLTRYDPQCIFSPLSHGHGGGVQHDEPELHPKLKESHAEDGHAHGYQVFHMEFERVELPFIIALWIFVSSLAKIGTDD